MQFEIKTTPKVKQFRFQLDMPFTKKTFRMIWQFYRSPDTWCSGQSSRCMDGKHILFFDYDHMGLKEIEDEVNAIQSYFKLSTAYVFENEKDKSYHVIILDKFPLFEAHHILKQTNVEWAYFESIRFVRGREWVLRITGKGKRPMPKFIKILYSIYDNQREISNAHQQFLIKYYGVPKVKYGKRDHFTTMPIINYNTGNRVD